MSKIKLALDVASDLKSLAESIETLVRAMEANEAVPTNEEPTKKKSKAKAKVEEVEPEVEEAPEEKQPTLEEVRAAMADKRGGEIHHHQVWSQQPLVTGS
jgi:transposase